MSKLRKYMSLVSNPFDCTILTPMFYTYHFKLFSRKLFTICWTWNGVSNFTQTIPILTRNRNQSKIKSKKRNVIARKMSKAFLKKPQEISVSFFLVCDNGILNKVIPRGYYMIHTMHCYSCSFCRNQNRQWHK